MKIKFIVIVGVENNINVILYDFFDYDLIVK